MPERDRQICQRSGYAPRDDKLGTHESSDRIVHPIAMRYNCDTQQGREGSHSGLVRAPAKRLSWETGIVGSNPTPSAIFQRSSLQTRNKSRMETYHIWTIGCQMNTADSERLGSALEQMGLTAVQRPTDADVVVLNSCVVRQSAEDKVTGTLNLTQPLRKKAARFRAGPHWLHGRSSYRGTGASLPPR